MRGTSQRQTERAKGSHGGGTLDAVIYSIATSFPIHYCVMYAHVTSSSSFSSSSLRFPSLFMWNGARLSHHTCSPNGVSWNVGKSEPVISLSWLSIVSISSVLPSCLPSSLPSFLPSSFFFFFFLFVAGASRGASDASGCSLEGQ